MIERAKADAYRAALQLRASATARAIEGDREASEDLLRRAEAIEAEIARKYPARLVPA